MEQCARAGRACDSATLPSPAGLPPLHRGRRPWVRRHPLLRAGALRGAVSIQEEEEEGAHWQSLLLRVDTMG
eukprot:5561872-Alexandrium_andersonii.AAC.1